jgi:hypothetical protein
VIALAAAAIEREALAAMAIDDVAQSGGNLGNRGVPVDRVKAAIGAPAQRRGQAIAVMCIERNARGLVAEIAFGFRVIAGRRALWRCGRFRPAPRGRN